MPRLEDVKWIDLPSKRDARGVLTSIEGNIDTPFPVRRIFYMHHIISDRGGHAHADTDQVVIATSGNFQIDLFDGITTKKYEMNDATMGLFVPRMIFIKLHGFSDDAVCLVLASTHYDISKSIRSLEEYMKAIKT